VKNLTILFTVFEAPTVMAFVTLKETTKTSPAFALIAYLPPKSV
jgi:hypothetical protein